MPDCPAPENKEIDMNQNDPYQQKSFRVCAFCRQEAWLYDDRKGTEPCDSCMQVEERRPSVWTGDNEWWIEKRSGRWFLMHHLHTNCNGRAVFRIDEPRTDKLYVDEEDIFRIEAWHGYADHDDYEIRPDVIW